jgi:nitroimidazol reductase NimA-like FMN-containing flavoprotein (pyridoxamine 5'-phosphate oxidase superfamily)
MTAPQPPKPEWEAFLAGDHVAVMAVASDDGRPPLAVPVWYHYEPGGMLTFFTGTQGRVARKTRLIQEAGGLSMVVQDERMPYHSVSVECRVESIDDAPSVDQVLAIVRRYLPEEHAQGFAASETGHPGSPFVLFTLRPERWHTFGFDSPAGA